MRKSGSWLANAVFACVMAGWGALALSQEFPTRPMKILVGYAPGGTPDVVARFLSLSMSATLGQPVTIENRTGAGGLPSVQELLRSPPDGYTMLIADIGVFAVLPAMRPGVYDPVRDMQALGQVTTGALFIMVNNSIAARNMQEFVALVKAKPGQYSYGSAGIGSIHHLFMEAVKAAYGLDIQHVPFKGSSQTLVSLLNGDIPIAIAGITTSQLQIKEGKLRALVASTRERDKVFAPDVPSTTEVGQPDIDVAGDLGYFLPVGTPRPIIEKLAAAIGKAAQSPEFAARAIPLGTTVLYRNADQFAEYVRASQTRYQRMVKVAGIKPE